MCNYNLVIIENKECCSYLNLTEQAFYDKLWEWTYEDDLWDNIDEENPTEEELEKLILQFIVDYVFHQYEDDDIDCFAFVNNNDEIREYAFYEDGLIDFIKSKIKEHYEKI